jgi:hypothetical protein
MPDKPGDGGQAAKPSEVELLKVVVTREGQKVSAQWGLHPQIKHDLRPEEWQQVSELMAKVTGIVGTRFAQILAAVEPDPPGTA